MYHKIKVAKNDLDTLQFTWGDSIDKEIMDYMMKVHIFGKLDYPCIANSVIKRTVVKQSSQHENEL